MRKKLSHFVVNLKEQEFEDVLSALTFTQHRYSRKEAPEFLAAIDKIVVKLWGVKKRQRKSAGEDRAK